MFQKIWLLPNALAVCLLLLTPASKAQSTSSVGQVVSITQEVFTQRTRPKVCWQQIITGREKALEEQASTPWLTKYWQPILGAAMGAPIAYSLTANYGADSQKWVWPTVAGGAAVGAVAGPGATAGAYGLGSLAYALWPTSLPLTIGLSLAGGVLGDLVWKMIFPPKKIPAAAKPGQYLPDQTFFLKTTCTKQPKIKKTSAGYLVKYLHNGKTMSARVRYYPGARITLKENGRPVDEIQDQQKISQK